MPHELDDIDIAVLTSLFKDGRKSFRQISRETKFSTPTVKARFDRLVAIGLIKSVVPIIDTTMIKKKSKVILDQCNCETKMPKTNLISGMSVEMVCDYCDGPIGSKPKIFQFGNNKRFFCCVICRATYKEKYKGRISILIKNKN